MTEVLAPTMIDYAPPELAAEMVPAAAARRRDLVPGLLRAGHRQQPRRADCRAGRVARRRGGWRVNGQKVWTSLAQYAQRCVLLVRTGTTESAHRGITALFVDMDAPGITVRPIETMHGAPSSARCSSTTSWCPSTALLGERGQGWAVAMDLLPYERSTALWHRGAFLHRRLVRAARRGAAGRSAARRGRRRWSSSLRLPRPVPRHAAPPRPPASARRRRRRSTRSCWPRASRRSSTSPRRRCPTRSCSATTPTRRTGAAEFLYSRAATIYGGSAEIQRNIIARRLLDLGADR